MKESLLQYIWKNALFETREYTADTGESIAILVPGKHSTDQGPDFTESKVAIAGTTWVGNIEIHTRASDWYDHGHHTNPDYNNVILHVVKECDRTCYNQKGRCIPSIALDYNEKLEQKYSQLMSSDRKIPCIQELQGLDRTRFSFWLNALVVERLEARCYDVKDLLKACGGSWEEAFYIQLARSFGLKINTLPFEMLAVSLPYKILLQEPGNLLRTEALLFGQAGFLDETPADGYSEQLTNEYHYQQKKYGLEPMQKHIWKFLRLRPLNFPTIRIAQFAGLLTQRRAMFAEAMELQSPDDFVNYFSCKVSAYWKNHYKFGSIAANKEKAMGVRTQYLIAVNAVLPFMFYYGRHKNSTALQERALHLMEQLPAEKNNISALWDAAGLKARNAAESQALLQLYKAYCEPRHCLQCQIGHHIINRFRTCSAKV